MEEEGSGELGGEKEIGGKKDLAKGQETLAPSKRRIGSLKE